jgi:hypothetical protein
MMESIHYKFYFEKLCRAEVVPSSEAYCKRPIGDYNEVGRRVERRGKGAIERLPRAKEEVTRFIFKR